MRKTKLRLDKESIRILTDRKMASAIGGGSLNCTSPTSSPLIEGCLAID